LGPYEFSRAPFVSQKNVGFPKDRIAYRFYPNRMKIAFLGLGAMGARMATSLLRASFDLTVWNRNALRTKPLMDFGAKAAISPREAVAKADVVIAMLHDDVASRDVWTNANYGALGAMKQGAIAIESSTLTLAWVKQLGVLSTACGVHFLDAPVAGSTPAAESKQLVYMVGGDIAVIERVRAILGAMGSTIHHAGTTGSGALAKLMVNSLLGVQAAAMAELVGLAERNHVDVSMIMEIVSRTAVCSPVANSAAKAMLENQFAPTFPIELLQKDMQYVAKCATDTDAHMPICSATNAVLKAAQQAGCGNEQYTAIVKLYR
jgi:3-hydroxyisobutyrate dehydrogenase